MKKEKNKTIYTKNDNVNKYNFKKKDSKQTKVILLIKDYFKKYNTISKDQFDEFLKFIELKSIWSKKEEQNYLWKLLLSYSKNKTSIDYNAAFKGISEFFKYDEEDSKNKKINNDSISNNIQIFEKYLKNLNSNHEFLYDIEFINYIFFNKDNISLNDINIGSIINDVKTKYKFLTINEKEIKSYLNCFSSYINKDLINKINIIIENILLEQNKNNNIILSDNNNSDIANLNYGELFDKLQNLDKIIFDAMDSLLLFYINKDLVNLTKKYIQDYLLFTKKNIYNNLKSLIEKDDKRKMPDSQNLSEKKEINNYIINNITKNFNIEKPKSKFLSNEDIFYIKKDLKKKISSSNLLNKNKDINDKNIINNNIEINDNNDNKNKKEDEEHLRKSILFKNYIHSRNKSDNNNLISLNFNKKLKKNISYSNLNKIEQLKETNTFKLINNSQYLSRNNIFTDKKMFQTQRAEDSLFNEGTIEDLNDFTFNDNINEQYLLENENIDDLENHEENDNNIEKNIRTLNHNDLIDNKDSYFDSDNDDNYKENNIENIENINIDKEKQNLSNCKDPINFTFGKEGNNNNNKNKIKIELSGDIDSSIPNYINKFHNNNHLLSLTNNNNKKFIKIFYYDFKYLYKNNNIKKLFNRNNEKINLMKFLTDEIYILTNNALKKQKAILVISASFFYFLKDNTQMTCIYKLNNKSLKSISISSRNCNLIILSFEKNEDIIIETYRRIEILRFIKENINIKNIKINISHNFKKNGDNELKKTKIFNFTPNFENAQKIGILCKYQENFFCSTFQEKLVVLCCLGLMYFDENEKAPKVIIPIIGTNIKFLSFQVQENEKLYCFQLKTINDEAYIFGSKIKKEIFDWIHEFSLIKKKYFLKLKEIEPNIVIHEKKIIQKHKKSN